MDYISQYNISNNQILGRLLPYFLRGRKFYSLLLSLISPLKSTHDGFLVWGQATMTLARTQFTHRTIEIMLKRSLSRYFKNENDEFKFDLFAHKNYDLYVDELESGVEPVYLESYSSPEAPTIYKRLEVTGKTVNRFNLSAPDVADPDKKEEYLTAINNYISQFTIIRKYDIIIQDL